VGTLNRHLSQYRAFKTSADQPGVEIQGRVEMLFLAAYHLIDACAAKHGIHINKHQNVRRELEANPAIFGADSKSVWESFDELQGRSRAKFVYGGTWMESDIAATLRHFDTIERVCLKVTS